MVSQKYFPLVSVFKVRPLKEMGELFFNSLPKEEIVVEGMRGNSYDGGFEYEKEIQAPIDILANLHRAQKLPLQTVRPMLEEYTEEQKYERMFAITPRQKQSSCHLF
jgi:hypothetical protein